MKIKSIAASLLLVFATQAAWAIPIANPAASLAGDDDGSSVYFADDVVVAIEILDLPTLLIGSPFPENGYAGSEFGFYYHTDPSNLITIFDAFDQNPDPGGVDDDPPVALINFLTGEVLDSDAGTVQSTFTTLADTPIGFYLSLSNEFVDFFGFDFDTVYTQSTLNADDEDMSAAFPLLSGLGYLMAFGTTNPFAEDSTLLLGLEVAINVSPTDVPEPSSIILLGSGLLLLWLKRRRRPLSH